MVNLLISLVSFFSFLFLNIFPNIYIFLVFILSWLILFLFLIYKFKIKKEQLLLYFINLLSFLIIFILVESLFFRIIINITLPFVFLFINFWLGTNLKRSIFLKEKPLRRIMMFLLVFNVFAFLSGVFAINNYFPNFSFFIPSFLAALFIAFISKFIWKMYFKNNEQKKINYWSCFIFLIIFELCLVFYFLPFGFFISSLLISWLWYIVQLCVRFHISSKGIIWKKQKNFLIINFLLFVALLFIIRWI